MGWWKRRRKHQPQVQAVFRRMASVAFPGGDNQIAEEAAEVVDLLQDQVSQVRAREILVHAKGRILIALRSASDDKEAVRRCAGSIQRRWPKELDHATAEQIASFACRRLVDQHSQSHQDLDASLANTTKEEALLVARITAYRLARHLGRTNAQVQQVYDLDPMLYIMRLAQDLITPCLKGRPKKIQTRRDAHDLCLNLASLLALAPHVDDNDASSAPDPEEIDRLAREELELTLSLLMEYDESASYADYDPSEVRAAHELNVPFDLALRLGEVGLLKDPPGPTESRRRSMNDAFNHTLRQLEDV